MRTSRLLAALLVAALCAAFASSALAGMKPTVKILEASQKQILRKGVEVGVKGTPGKRAKVRAKSTSFDHSTARAITERKTVKLGRSGKRTVALRLVKDGKRAISSCAAREITIKHAKKGVDLVRDTALCRPRRIDLSAADRCDFIGAQDGSLCMLPFPDDYYTVKDSSTPTGRRIDFGTAAMPQNEDGVSMAGKPYNLNDGFSPGQSMVIKVPGLDTQEALDATASVRLSKLGQYDRARQPIVVIDARTGERWPIWTEIDSHASTPDRAALLIHPAENFAAGHRYIVAMRNLEDGDGDVLDAPQGFRYYRDDLPSKKAAINSQRRRFERIFKTLRRARINRSDLYLAWDFTVASDESIAGRLLEMRDDAMAQLGDTTMTDLQTQGTAPSFSVTSVESFTLAEDANMARRVQGTFTVPCYLAPNCDSGVPAGTFDLDRDGNPVQHGTYTANFNCMIPRSAIDGTPGPARPSLYGHGLLGSAGETTSDPQKTLGNNFNFVSCGTDEIGLSGGDIPLALSVLQEMGKFPQIADRLQQGLLNEMLLGRLMLSAGGFVADPAFHVDGGQPVGASPYVIDPSRLYYNGNSQGAIEGGALVATSPDVTRGSLGVGGMNYSVLLNRSVDFDQYATIGLNPAYADELERPLVISLVQMLWDRGESNGYARTIGDDPLPDTPASEVIMNVGLGDHQVSSFTADTMARTIDARVRAPIAYTGRWPDVQKAWDVPRISSYPYSGSALIYWDSGPIRPDPTNPGEELGTNVPPIDNQPNRDGRDPHELPRRTLAEQQMVSDFLQPDAASEITDTCNGKPCYDYTFPGP